MFWASHPLVFVVGNIRFRFVTVVPFFVVLFARQVYVGLFLSGAIARGVRDRVGDLTGEVFRNGPLPNGVVHDAVYQEDACGKGSHDMVRSFVRYRDFREDRSLVVVRD